jgi:hypothetical protein
MTKCVEELRKVLEATDLGIHSDEDFVFVCLECRTVFDDQDDCLDHRRNHGLGHSEFVHWDRHDDGDCVETYSVENEQVKMNLLRNCIIRAAHGDRDMSFIIGMGVIVSVLAFLAGLGVGLLF